MARINDVSSDRLNNDARYRINLKCPHKHSAGTERLPN